MKKTKKTKKVKALNFKYETVSLNKITMSDWNYKTYSDDALQAKLVENIRKNGQIENLIIRELEDGEYELVNGHHRYLAMKELGLTEAMCCNVGRISLIKAKRIAIETNETKFKTDDAKLAEIINDIVLEEEDFDLTNPFSEEEMKELNKFNSDIENETITQSTPKKTTKTKTAVSLAGEKYTTVKIEATPEHAEQFTGLIQRFKFDLGSEGESLSIICKFMGKFTDEDILKAVGASKSNKKTRKKALKSGRPS